MSVTGCFRAGPSLALAFLVLWQSAWGESAWESFARYEWPRVLTETGTAPGPDYYLVAAFVTTLPDIAAWKPGQFYTAALAARPRDPLTLYTAATWCFYSPDQVACLDADLLEDLANADPDNGIPLIMSAIRELINRNDERALELVERAAASPKLDAYWGQMAGVLRRTIRDTVRADMGDPGKLAIGLALARPQVEAGMHDVCTSPGAKLTDRNWNRACLVLGRALEERGTTLLMAQLGVSVQRRILKMQDDTAALAELEKRAVALEELEITDQLEGALAERYWSDLELYGELEALRRAAAVMAPGT